MVNARPGYFYDTVLKRILKDPAGTFSLAGATMPTADPGGTFSAAGASAATTDPAGTYTSPYALNRMIIDWQNIVPEGMALAFHSVQEVQNYFGVGSTEDMESRTFFGPNDVYGLAGATLYVTRDPLGQRPHILGANLYNDTLAQLQAIQGSLSVEFDGFQYSAPSIDLSGVSGPMDNAINEAAKIVQADLNQHRQTAAVITGHIVSHTVTFEGTIDKAQVTVTKIDSGGSLPVGAIITGPGIPGGTNSQIIHDIDGAGGPGHYTTFHSAHLPNPVTGTFEATYGVLTVDSVISGTVTNGLQVVGDGVTGLAPATGMVDPLSANTWIVNNATAVGEEQMTLKAPLLGVYMDRNGQPIIGATEHNDFLDLSVQGEFGFDQNPSQFGGDPTGTAADALGLTQASGAFPAEPGGQHMSLAHFMTLTKSYVDQFGDPVNYGSFITNDTRFNDQFTAWADTPQGMATEFLTANRAAGTSHAITDPLGTHSGPGASTPIWGSTEVKG
jgi:hypothetical protein